MCRSRMSVLSVCFAVIIFCLSSIASPLLHPAYAQIELYARLIRSFPSPGPSPQDLAWDGHHIWVADDSTDVLYKVDSQDGSVISTLPSPGASPWGLTWDGSHLWCSLKDSLRFHSLDPADGSIVYSIPGWQYVTALTWDGRYLWCADFRGWSSMVRQISPEDGSVVSQFFNVLEALAFDGIDLWGASYTGGHIEGIIDRLSVPEGNYVAFFHTTSKSPTGLTFDGQYFWLADNGMDTIEKLSVKGDVDNDAVLNILDAMRCVNIILNLGQPATEFETWGADYNWDGKINVLDIVGIINEILAQC